MQSGIASYFESSILTADPVELLRMLYRGAIEAVEKAREHLREGDIAARSAQLTKAGAIIAHLTFSVKPDADPRLGRNLIELYDYMQRRLLRGNFEQADGPLAEVSKLLGTLLEAWNNCTPDQPEPAGQGWGRAPAESETVSSYAPAGRFAEANSLGGYTPLGSLGQAGPLGAYGSGETLAGPEPLRGCTGPEAAADREPVGEHASLSAFAPAEPSPRYAPAMRGYAPAGMLKEAPPEAEYATQSWSF